MILLGPYHRSPSKRLIKTPKLYFADSGLLIYLLGFTSWAAVIQNAVWGALWENLVIAEAWRYFLNAGKRPPLWFWRTAQGEELDLLIEIAPQRFLAVECKVAAAIERRHLKGFGVFEEVYGPAVLHRGAVVCRTEQPYPLTEHGRITALPLGGTQGLCQWIGEQIAA